MNSYFSLWFFYFQVILFEFYPPIFTWLLYSYIFLSHNFQFKFQRLGSSDVCAVWNDQRKVQIWNLNPFISCIENISLSESTKSIALKNEKPLFSKEYSAEGFALAWSPLQTGSLATGDHHRKVYFLYSW